MLKIITNVTASLQRGRGCKRSPKGRNFCVTATEFIEQQPKFTRICRSTAPLTLHNIPTPAQLGPLSNFNGRNIPPRQSKGQINPPGVIYHLICRRLGPFRLNSTNGPHMTIPDLVQTRAVNNASLLNVGALTMAESKCCNILMRNSKRLLSFWVLRLHDVITDQSACWTIVSYYIT